LQLKPNPTRLGRYEGQAGDGARNVGACGRGQEKAGWIVTEPKTENSVGDVPINDFTVWQIKLWLQRREKREARRFAVERARFLFCTEVGTPLGNNMGASGRT